MSLHLSNGNSVCVTAEQLKRCMTMLNAPPYGVWHNTGNQLKLTYVYANK